MAGIQLSGLASGFDWTSLVTQLDAVAKVPQDNLRTEQSTLASKNTAIAQIQSALADLKTSLKDLGTGNAFQQRSATTSGSSVVSAAPGTKIGNYSVSVTKLATAARVEGSADAGGPISSSSNVSGVVISAMNLGQRVTAGAFTVNGARITVATTDTLQDVFNRISSATGGQVTASYDPAQDKITLSGSNVTLGSANDTSNFLQATKLFNNGGAAVSSATNLGVAKLTGPLASAGLRTPVTAVNGSGDGTFEINGVDIAFNVNNDSIQNVVDRINGSSAGVIASYDSNLDRFVLTNSVTGDLGISVQESAGGLLGALGLGTGSTSVVGKNAEFSLDGGNTVISTTNTFDLSTLGATGLSVTARALGTESIQVAGDSSGSQTKIATFIAKYNTVQSLIASNTSITVSGNKVTSATLAGDREIEDIGRSLRAMVFSAAPGSTSTVKRLSDLGIDFDGVNSTLSVKNSTTLNDALSNQSSDVANFFGDSVSGMVTRLGGLLDREIGVGGSLPAKTARNTKQSTDLDKQIAAMQIKLDLQHDLLESSFIQMENAQAQIKSQSAALTQAFSTTSS